jgi:hypothetical protein
MMRSRRSSVASAISDGSALVVMTFDPVFSTEGDFSAAQKVSQIVMTYGDL